MRGQSQVQAVDYLLDPSIAEQGHADDEPHDLLRRQPPLAYRRGTGRVERLLDPPGLNVAAEIVEVLGNRSVLRDRRDRMLDGHYRPLPGEAPA